MSMDSRLIAMFGCREDAVAFFMTSRSHLGNWHGETPCGDVVVATVSRHIDSELILYFQQAVWKYPDEVVVLIKDEEWPWRILYMPRDTPTGCLRGMATLASVWNRFDNDG